MKRYSFRLAPVLRVRRSEEDAARGALLAATAAVTAQERLLAERQEAYAAAMAPKAAASASDFRADQLRRQAYGAAVLEQSQRVEQARAAQDSARGAWSAAAARVGALERLEERAREEHRVAELREDDLIADELVVSRFGREVG